MEVENKYTYEWYEDLPSLCPPKDAITPNDTVLYRLGTSDFPTNNDFLSQRFLNPENLFTGVSECLAKSISVLNNLDACDNMIKLPRLRKRFKSIIELKLDENDGLIKKTFKKPEHFSWWRSKSFNFENSEKVKVIR